MPQDVELGGLREHPNDPAAVYDITLRGTPPAGLTARFPSMTLHSIVRWSGPKGQHRPLAPRARSSSGLHRLDLAEVLEQIRRHRGSDSDLVRRFSHLRLDPWISECSQNA
jgi:hypothetical protein